MDVPIANAHAEHQLRRNSLGLPELVFQGVTHIAPATNVVFAFPIVALQAGPAMPVSFLLSTSSVSLLGTPYLSSPATSRRAAATIASPRADSGAVSGSCRPGAI